MTFVALMLIILNNTRPVSSYNIFQKIQITMNIIKEYIFSLLSFYSSFDTFDANIKHTFLVPKLSVIISCTVIFKKI